MGSDDSPTMKGLAGHRKAARLPMRCARHPVAPAANETTFRSLTARPHYLNSEGSVYRRNCLKARAHPGPRRGCSSAMRSPLSKGSGEHECSQSEVGRASFGKQGLEDKQRPFVGISSGRAGTRVRREESFRPYTGQLPPDWKGRPVAKVV